MKTIFSLEIIVENLLSLQLVVLSFKMTGNSTTCFDVLANAFAVLALNEYNFLASEFYLLFLDSFHSELYFDENYMILCVKNNQAKSSYIWTVTSLILSIQPHQLSIYHRFSKDHDQLTFILEVLFYVWFFGMPVIVLCLIYIFDKFDQT